MFKPRLTAPNDNLPYYMVKNGYNECIERKNGSALPNCVGYAWGRAYEILGYKPTLSKGNAENWFGYTQDGYTRGQTPKLGAIICWQKGKAYNQKDGAGHVAVVEEISPINGKITVSASNYSGARWYKQILNPPNYSIGGMYKFQGFIYLPIGDDKMIEPTTRNQFKTQIFCSEKNKNNLRAHPYLTATVVGALGSGHYDVLDIVDMRNEASNGKIWYKLGSNQNFDGYNVDIWTAHTDIITFLPANNNLDNKYYEAIKQIKDIIDNV